MIESIRGILLENRGVLVVVECAGVGYGLHVSLPTGGSLPAIGSEVFLYAHMQVREDAMELFGFGTMPEKDMFRMLIQVSGIGPRMALRLLSECAPQDLAQLILQDNISGLTKLKGIGKKTAEILALHLKPMLAKANFSSPTTSGVTNLCTQDQEAVLALIALGLKDTTARKAVESARQEAGDAADLSSIITLALRKA
jgi:holliday junction DNA helicase RuvA